MDAVISGRSGTALLIEGDIWLSFSVDDQDSLVSRGPADLRLLFGDAIDLQFVNNTDKESVVKALRLERSVSSSLDLVLVLLDRDISEKVRGKAAAALEYLIADDRVYSRLEGILYAQPLPRIADVRRALKYCHQLQEGLTYSLLQKLKGRQALVKEVRLAWEAMSSDLFESEEQRAEFHYMSVKEGLFRNLVTADVNTFLKACESNPNINSLPGSQVILRRWVSNLHRVGTALPKPHKATAKSRKVKPPVSRIIDREVVIIGGGVLGALTAVLAAEHGMKDIVVFDTPDGRVDRLEDIGNYAWLQAGLHAWLQPEITIQNLILGISGTPHYLTQLLGTLPNREERGRSHVLDRYLSELGGWPTKYSFNDEVIRLLTALPSSYDVSARLLDVSSRTSNIMRLARDYGVHFVRSDVRLLPEPNSRTGFLVGAENKLVEPRFTILSTDIRQEEHLNQIGLNQRSIWRPHSFGEMNVGLLEPSPRLIITDSQKFSRRMRLFSLDDSRASTTSHESNWWAPLAYHFSKTFAASKHALNKWAMPRYGVAAHFKTYLGMHKHEDVEHAFSRPFNHLHGAANSLIDIWPDRYPGLIAARPGAATLGSYTADLIFNVMRSSELYRKSELHREPFYTRFVRHKSDEGDYEKNRSLYERAKKRNTRREQKR